MKNTGLEKLFIQAFIATFVGAALFVGLVLIIACLGVGAIGQVLP
jgi:hypothetical protein